ncbi:MAG: hypothetical protein ACRDTG_27945 [Pseudonocardiaceae bacterium]
MYRIRVYEEVQATVATLPFEAHVAWIELLDALELTPWNGESQNARNPDGEVRRFVFGPGGAGLVVYLILEDQQLVDIVQVTWLG